jgi:hypothetical protein
MQIINPKYLFFKLNITSTLIFTLLGTFLFLRRRSVDLKIGAIHFCTGIETCPSVGRLSHLGQPCACVDV